MRHDVVIGMSPLYQCSICNTMITEIEWRNHKCRQDNQPKEKPMENRVIFESEEEARNVWNIGLKSSDDIEFISELKSLNLIRKTAVEEAEQRYENIKQYHTEDNSDAWRLAVSYHNAIHSMKNSNQKMRG